jgi:UDP-N-acetylmuramyl pentapeptide phosphotransferase/UDP-N-acetylglucosamine-1-phosphate transferase
MILIASVVLVSSAICAGLIMTLRPVLMRYALARPNARSSHTVPTPQGGGIAVVTAALLVSAMALSFSSRAAGLDESLMANGAARLAWVFAATIAIALVGAVDDLRPLPASLRLALQFLAVGAAVASAGDGARLMPHIVPLWAERGLVVVAGVWFVNLVNFMDGVDWMTVAEIVPVTGFCALALLLTGAGGAVPALALFGALLGFAPFNKPRARLFLGDVGSLPIGLMVGWMLYGLALSGGLAAAILLPLYYLADATITLFRRLAAGERVWEAHRRHFYQQAIDRNGFSVVQVVSRVFTVNLILGVLALTSLMWPAWPVQVGAVVAGSVLVALLLRTFSAPHAIKAPA